MPAGFYEPVDDTNGPKRLFLYGPPKSVKTPLALAYGAYLRTRNPKAKTLYVAADRGSEDLPSLPDESWFEWIKVWKPGSPLEPGYDPYNEAIQVAMTDWKTQDPDFELLIWDTMTMDCERILQYVADQEMFASAKSGDKHITFGDPTLPKGHPARLNIPVQGDYNGVNGIAKRLCDFLASQKMHVLVVNHEAEVKDQKGIKRLGPAFVGQALTGKLPGWLTGIIYVEKFGEVDIKTGKITSQLYVCSDPADDLHMAGIRHRPIKGNPKNPIGRVKVNDLVGYWKLFHETLFPTPVNATTNT